MPPGDVINLRYRIGGTTYVTPLRERFCRLISQRSVGGEDKTAEASAISTENRVGLVAMVITF